MLGEFWREIDRPIHPLDEPIFDEWSGRHCFDLRFPPPAFIGDPNAPIVILLANGGKSRREEAWSRSDIDAFYASLRGTSFKLPDNYGSDVVKGWVKNGEAVRVNAIAYRSKEISSERANRKLAELLPSVSLHRRWLRDVVLPQAHRGERFIIAHRNGMWRFPRTEAAAHVVFTPNPRSSFPANVALEQAQAWLATRRVERALEAKRPPAHPAP